MFPYFRISTLDSRHAAPDSRIPTPDLRHALTQALIEAICTRVRAGAFEQVAVEAMEVPWEVYQDWLRLAEQPDCPAECRRLVDKVREARATARLKAEMELHDSDAKVWLLHGPGRETAGREGWGIAGKAHQAGATCDVTLLLELCAVIIEALETMPEARVLAAAAVDRWGKKRSNHKLGHQP